MIVSSINWNRTNEIAKPTNHQIGVLRFRTIELILSVTEANVSPGSDDRMRRVNRTCRCVVRLPFSLRFSPDSTCQAGLLLDNGIIAELATEF